MVDKPWHLGELLPDFDFVVALEQQTHAFRERHATSAFLCKTGEVVCKEQGQLVWRPAQLRNHCAQGRSGGSFPDGVVRLVAAADDETVAFADLGIT